MAVAEDLVETGTKTAVEAVLAQIAEVGLTGAVAGQDSRTLVAGKQAAVEIWVAAGSAEQAAAETWAAATAVLVFQAQQTL